MEDNIILDQPESTYADSPTDTDRDLAECCISTRLGGEHYSWGISGDLKYCLRIMRILSVVRENEFFPYFFIRKDGRLR